MRTTYHDPDGWPQPPRAPLHAAAPFGMSSPAGLHAHRALRLFVTAGTWAAGLCLVIGSIVLVVSAATPGRITGLDTASSGHHGTTSAAGVGLDPLSAGAALPPAGQAVASRPIASFAGRGDQTTAEFRVHAGARWQIRWSYSCPQSIRAGLLVVENARAGAVGASITEAGLAGRGETWLNAGARRHRLIVISTCSWHMKVMQHR
jgi:hypothetical protein